MAERKQELDGPNAEIEVNPFRCRMWELHDRLDEYVNEETCKAEIESFMRQGQVVAAMGRRLHGDPDYDVELIFGARRLFVARHVNRPLRVRLVELSDQQALMAMDVENRQRKDISPYERSLSLARWLRAGFFDSQEQMARALGVSPSQISRLLRIARLPSVILNAFEPPVDILERWGVDLAAAWEDPERRPALIRRARAIAAMEPRPSAQVVYEQLMSRLNPKRTRRPVEVILDAQRRPLFRVSRMRRAVVLSLPAGTLSQSALEEIKASVTSILARGKGVSTRWAAKPEACVEGVNIPG